MDYLNHHVKGFEVISHKDKTLVTSNPSISFENFILNFKKVPFKIGYIPPGYEHRADLISDLFYNNPTLDWLILMFNDIKDPFNELNVNDRILIPII